MSQIGFLKRSSRSEMIIFSLGYLCFSKYRSSVNQKKEATRWIIRWRMPASNPVAASYKEFQGIKSIFKCTVFLKVFKHWPIVAQHF